MLGQRHVQNGPRSEEAGPGIKSKPGDNEDVPHRATAQGPTPNGEVGSNVQISRRYRQNVWLLPSSVCLASYFSYVQDFADFLIPIASVMHSLM